MITHLVRFETPLGSQNAFMFLVIASNECGTSQGAIDPIRIHGTPDPLIQETINSLCQSGVYIIHLHHQVYGLIIIP